MTDPKLKIREYDFNPDIIQKIQGNHYANSKWPIVYILSGDKSDKRAIYIGETGDAIKDLNNI